jgi:hypothetical protein
VGDRKNSDEDRLVQRGVLPFYAGLPKSLLTFCVGLDSSLCQIWGLGMQIARIQCTTNHLGCKFVSHGAGEPLFMK